MELAILVGLQASGKSSFYRARFAATHELVSKDLLRNNSKPERRQRQLIEEALAAGRSVVVDNTNATPELRAPLIALGQQHGATVTGYYFAAEVAGCLARNRAREGRARVPDVAIFATRKILVPPTRAEGFDALFVVRLEQGGGFAVEAWDETSCSAT
jgi:predicted kinase